MKFFINARFLTQPVSGVQRYGIECSRQIKALYPKAIFLAPGNIVNSDIANELGAIVIGRSTSHLWEQWDLPKYIKRQGGGLLLNLANTGPLLCRNNFTVIHDLAFFHHPEWNSRLFATWYNYLVPRLAKRSRHVFTVSETIKKELVTYYHLPESKVSVTYNGVGECMLHEQQGDVVKEKVILSVGTFNIRKNQQQLVKGFLKSAIKDDHILVLAGDRNKVFAESGITDDMAGDRIKIYEKLSDADLADLYKRAEIVVSLSDYEGFGIPIIEGLHFGCKIMCSDIPVYHELFEQVAVFCHQDDTDSVAQQLAHTAKNVNGPPDKGIVKALLLKYNYAKAAEVIMTQLSASGI